MPGQLFNDAERKRLGGLSDRRSPRRTQSTFYTLTKADKAQVNRCADDASRLVEDQPGRSGCGLLYRMSDGRYHGFLLSNGTYTSIDYPNATYTSANGINDLGEIVGRWDDATGHTHGFYAVKQ